MTGVLAIALVKGSQRAYYQLASMARSSIQMEKARSDLEDAIESKIGRASCRERV